MSTAELLKIVHQLEELEAEQVNFILAQYLKNKAKTKDEHVKNEINKLSQDSEDSIRKSLDDYKNGRYTLLSTMAEIENHFKAL